MKYEEAVEYINEHGKELEFDKELQEEFLVFIAPTDPKHYEEFERNYVLNYYNPLVIQPFCNEDVCVMRVMKKGLPQRAFIQDIVAV